MPDCKIGKTESNNERSACYKDVVIIGNGPSGLCLSHLLAGNRPYWNKTRVSDEYLQMRLEYCDNGKSLVEQDLEYLSDGLEGRSNNPVAVLYDALKQPDSDMGMESPTCLAWRYEPLNEINHIVIGKAEGPGGAWNDLDGSQLTISPSKWMELPNMSYSNWEHQNKLAKINPKPNAGIVFSAKNSNFSEDNSLLNANHVPKPSRSDSSYNLKKYLKDLNPQENDRASMHDVRNYYRDFVKQKNMDKYLLNNATVATVKRIHCSKLACQGRKTNEQVSNGANDSKVDNLWEVSGIIDKRDRSKASSLSQGEICEFRFVCKHLVLATGANDSHNSLNVRGENFRYIIRSIRELEEKILEDSPRLRKDPLLIIGAGLSAADAIILAQKHKIKIIHVIRRSVHDPNLVFKTLPKKMYPEYHDVHEQMLAHKTKPKNINDEVLKELSQNDLNNNNFHYVPGSVEENGKNSDNETPSYTLYDEHQVKYFTSKRTCKLIPLSKSSTKTSNVNSNTYRPKHLQKQHHDLHRRQLEEFDEEQELPFNQNRPQAPQGNETEIKISFACILIGYAPDLDFLPTDIINDLPINPNQMLDTKNNPIMVDKNSHESIRRKNLYAMGPLIGDNFVRFGTGGALAISNRIAKYEKEGQQCDSSNSS